MAEQITSDEFQKLHAHTVALLEEREGDAALAASRQLVEHFPNDARSHLLQARILAALNQPKAALETLRATRPLHDGNPKALAMMRTIAASAGEAEEALNCARKIAAIAPHERKNLIFLTEAYLQSGDTKAALASSEALLAQHEGEPQAWLLRAAALAAAGRAKDGLRALRSGVARHPASQPLLKAARNAAIDRERPSEAVDYAERMLALDPADRKNMATVVQLRMRGGEFAKALAHAETMVALAPNESDGVVLRAQCLAAMNKAGAALAALRDALTRAPDDVRLLVAARNLAFQHGRFNDARDYGTRLRQIGQDDKKGLEYIAQAMMAVGDTRAVGRFIESVRKTPGAPVLKTAHHLQNLEELKRSSPMIVEAWHAAMTNAVDGELPTATAETVVPLGATMIQYWSQGVPPHDVRIVLKAWQELFEREQLGRVELFDRVSAAEWIDANAPEFSALFAGAFHYAMESDVFRIAYASKRPCIYVDIDGWPLEHSAEILRGGVNSGSSLLYFRSYRPWIVNGFFIARPDCPFFQLLVEQALAVDLTTMPKDHATIEQSFGPTRYNAVLVDLLARAGHASVTSLEVLGGCSQLRIGDKSILFTHEAAVASVRPPFRLGYKVTGDYWKGISIPS